ncbi:serum amyloid P-component-like [Antennarius striatus]|uniref:serum amyloid P-component-like n=1 Tax=Antennarius striatus TaxID=241820 RepID=UPI0035AF021A
MEKLLLLMVVFATCHAVTKDMSGKVFVFPKETKTDHVKLLTSQSRFSALTTCLRFQTDLARNYVLFSMATTAHSNDFVLFKTNSNDVIRTHAREGGTDFQALSLSRNTWHSLCSTWSSDSGLAQLWVDGKATIIRFIKTGAISGAPITILGQEQDSYGGGFDESQSFMGMITDVHVWDSVIPSQQIKLYMNGKYFSPGNVFNWRSLSYDVIGQVVVAEERDVK